MSFIIAKAQTSSSMPWTPGIVHRGVVVCPKLEELVIKYEETLDVESVIGMVAAKGVKRTEFQVSWDISRWGGLITRNPICRNLRNIWNGLRDAGDDERGQTAILSICSLVFLSSNVTLIPALNV